MCHIIDIRNPFPSIPTAYLFGKAFEIYRAGTKPGPVCTGTLCRRCLCGGKTTCRTGRPEHTTYCLDDCIRSIDGCVQHIGEPVHLVGLCQGGWQSAIYAALFSHNVKILSIDDPVFVERHRRFNNWYQFTQPLAGRMYIEIVGHLFKENLLVKGGLEILGCKVDLSKIYQPLNLIAGTKDDITPPDQLFAIENYVSSLIVDKKLADAGHIGVFLGKSIIKNIWTDLFKRLPAYQIGVEPFRQCACFR